MGIFSRFENKMEDTFEGAADIMSNAPISPVQIAKKAEKQMRREKMVGAGKEYAPTLYTVLVNPDDDARLFGIYPTLAGETETYLAAKAAQEGLAMDGDPLVRFVVDEGLRHGKFEVIAEVVAGHIVAQLRQEEMERYGLAPRAEQGYTYQQPRANDAWGAYGQQPAQAQPAQQPQAEPAQEQPRRKPPLPYVPEEEIDRSIDYGEYTFNSEDFEDYRNKVSASIPVPSPAAAAPAEQDAYGEAPYSDYADYGEYPEYPEYPEGGEGAGHEAYGEQGYDPAYEQPYEPAYGQPYEPAYGQPYEPAYGQPYEPAYGQGYDRALRPDYDQEPPHYQPQNPYESPTYKQPATRAPQPQAQQPQPQQQHLRRRQPQAAQAPQPQQQPANTVVYADNQNGSQPNRQSARARIVDVAYRRAYDLAGTHITIGRESSNDIVVQDINASRKHAELRLTPQGVWAISDLHSMNGTLVNGVRVATQPLQSGDTITVGKTNLEFMLL